MRLALFGGDESGPRASMSKAAKTMMSAVFTMCRTNNNDGYPTCRPAQQRHNTAIQRPDIPPAFLRYWSDAHQPPPLLPILHRMI